jgi:hypothetical protein
MHLRTRFFMLMFVILTMGLANSAFAQLSCSVASTPVSRATDTGLTEPAGDLIFNCTAGVIATTSATMTVDFGVPITDNTVYPTVAPGGVRIGNLAGSFLAAGAPTISSVNNSGGQIIIAIPAQAVPATGSFTLSGVLVALADSGKTTLNATLSVSPGNNVLITAGQNVATVISTILPGIKAPVLTTTSPASSGVILSSNIIVTPGFSFKIDENYIDMLRTQAQFNAGASTNATQILLTFAGLPTGVSLTGCTAGITTGAASLSATSITSTANTLTVDITANPLLTTVDTVTIACTGITVGTTATVPLAPGSVTVTATLAPTGTALSSAGAVLTSATTGQVPRYKSNPIPSPALQIFAIVPSTTNFIIPFAVVGSGGYDTGIAVANTTADNYGLANGGARPQDGTVTFNFFPTTGSSFSFTPTTGSVGLGLSSTGVLQSGRTYSVLLSELLKASSGAPTSFTGYIIAVANFSNGHGTSFVTDFKTFTSASPVLVIAPPALVSRSALAVTATEGTTR